MHTLPYPNAYRNRLNFGAIRGCPPLSLDRVDLRRPYSGGHLQIPFGYLGVEGVSNPVSQTLSARHKSDYRSGRFIDRAAARETCQLHHGSNQ